MSIYYYTFSPDPYLKLHESAPSEWGTDNCDPELKKVYTIGEKEYEVCHVDLCDLGIWGIVWRILVLVAVTFVTIGGAWVFKPFRALLDEVRTQQEIVRHATFIDPATLNSNIPTAELKGKEAESPINFFSKEKRPQTEPLSRQKHPPTSTGEFPERLLEAFKQNNEKVFISLLDDKSIDINAKDERDPLIFHMLEKRMSTCFAPLVEHHQFDANVRNNDNQTPLEYLIKISLDTKEGEIGRYDMYGALYSGLLKKTDLKQPFSDGRSPFDHIFDIEKAPREMILNWFIEASAEIDDHIVARLAFENATKLLTLALPKCNNPNIEDENQNSPLSIFLQNANLHIDQIRDILRLFKSKHANFHARNKEGKTLFRSYFDTIQQSAEGRDNLEILCAYFLSVLPSAYQEVYLNDLPLDDSKKTLIRTYIECVNNTAKKPAAPKNNFGGFQVYH